MRPAGIAPPCKQTHSVLDPSPVHHRVTRVTRLARPCLTRMDPRASPGSRSVDPCFGARPARDRGGPSPPRPRPGASPTFAAVPGSSAGALTAEDPVECAVLGIMAVGSERAAVFLRRLRAQPRSRACAAEADARTRTRTSGPDAPPSATRLPSARSHVALLVATGVIITLERHAARSRVLTSAYEESIMRCRSRPTASA